MNAMKIAVMGGGNGSHTIAADLTLKGHRVNMFELEIFAEKMDKVFKSRQIEISGVAGQGKAQLNLVTTDIKKAIEDVEIIFIPLPGFVINTYGELLAPHLKEGQLVVIMPGTLGSLEFRNILKKKGNKENIVLAEIGGLPFATRLIEPGKVKTFHIRSICPFAALPGNRTSLIYDKIKKLYPSIKAKKSVVETGFGFLNPVLHPAGVLLNTGRIERSHGDFYMYEEGMTPSVVKVVESVDRERLAIGEKMGIKLPTAVEMMVESGYGPEGTLWQSINASEGLTPIKGPDSLNNRYVTEDVPYGLVVWASMGDAAGIETPMMDALIEIGSTIMGVDCWKEGRNLEKMGIDGLSLEQIIQYLETGEHPEQK
ncbi:MAG: dehydrogenase [Spirochaetes bacterium]|nr:dehydrogenase [Spirochaetota bacterium]